MSDAAKRLIIPAHMVEALAALSNAPEEQCGLLLGRIDDVLDDTCAVLDELMPSDNLATNPAVEFEIDVALRLRVQRQLRDEGRAVLGLYHTHPSGSAVASKTDHARAKDEPGLIWLIAAAGGMQAYIASTDGLFPIEWVEQ